MTYEKINAYVEENKDAAIDMLTKAIQIPSVTGEEKNISLYFQDVFKKMNLETQVIALDEERPNLIATWEGNKEKTFIFNGHYDVFPPNQDNPGTYGPWSAKIVDGNMYGRGTVDMKGGICAAVMAVKFLQELNFDPQGNIVISLDVDEESGGKYGVEHVLNQGYLKGDYGVCMEATEGKVQVEGGGGIFVKVVYRSESWHGAFQRNCMDALQKGHQALQKLYELDDKIRKEKYYDALNGGAFLSVTEFYAGEAMNVHPGMCSITIDRRIIPSETPESAYQEICDALDELKHENPEMDYEIDLLSRMPALKVDERSPVVISALKSYEKVFAAKSDVYRRTGGTDSAKIVEKYGFSMPNFGPGIADEQTMSPNEHLSIQEYLDYIKVYMLMVCDLLGKEA